MKTHNEEEITNLKEKMRDILHHDQNLNKQGKPATLRLKNLDMFMKNLYKIRSSIDTELLNILKLWLEPLPNKSLPNIKIKLEIINFIENLNLSKDMLISSEIGHIIHFYSKYPKVENEIRKKSRNLVRKWTAVAMTDCYEKE